MKNIETILTEAGITLTDEQSAAITKAVAENYKTVAEFNAKTSKLTSERDSYKEQYEGVKESLSKFDGVDVDSLKKQIEEANQRAQDAATEAENKLKARDYADAVKMCTAGINFSSEAARRDFTAQLQEKNLPLNDGKLLGMSDFLSQYKEANEGAIVDESAAQKAKFTDPMNGGNKPTNARDVELERTMRAAMGISKKDEE